MKIGSRVSSRVDHSKVGTVIGNKEVFIIVQWDKTGKQTAAIHTVDIVGYDPNIYIPDFTVWHCPEEERRQKELARFLYACKTA